MTLQNTRDVLQNLYLTKWWIASEVNKQFRLGGLFVDVANYTAYKWQALFFIGIWPASLLSTVNKRASSSFRKKCIFSRLLLLNRGFGLKVIFTVHIQKNGPLLCIQQLLSWWWCEEQALEWEELVFVFFFFLCERGSESSGKMSWSWLLIRSFFLFLCLTENTENLFRGDRL